MNTIKFIIVVSMVLLGTDLVYHQVVNGQINITEEQMNETARVAKSLVDNIIANNTNVTKLNNSMNSILDSFADKLRANTEQRIRDNPNMTFDECMQPIDTSPITCMKFFNVNETEMDIYEAHKRIDEAAGLK